MTASGSHVRAVPMLIDFKSDNKLNKHIILLYKILLLYSAEVIYEQTRASEGHIQDTVLVNSEKTYKRPYFYTTIIVCIPD